MKDIKILDHNARYTFLGAIFGALVGGVFSFGGTFLTSQTQSQQLENELRRSVYVNFISDADKYKLNLQTASWAVSEGDETTYRERWERSRQLIDELQQSMIEASLVTENREAIYAVTEEYYEYPLPYNMEDCDISKLREAGEAGADATDKLIAIAMNDIK